MSETRYPLVDERTYGNPQNRIGVLRKRWVRGDDDLPALAAHHVRVFRVGDRYIEEHGQARRHDETVVNASSVTIVDRRVDVPVVAEFPIPSSGVGAFTVQITFLCTVKSATAVVRDGVTDAPALLEGYVRRIPDFADQGADLPTTAAATVRHRLDALLTAFLEMRPPTLSGMSIALATVAVLTPEELESHLLSLEQARLDRQREAFDADLALAREEDEQARKLLEQRHEQELDRLQSGYDQLLRAQNQMHDLRLQADKNNFNRAETVEDLRLLGNDPTAADLNAYHSRGLSAVEYADRVHARENRAEERRIYEDTHSREDARYRLERDDRRLELEHQERRADKQDDRAEDTRRWNETFIQEQLRLREQREDHLSERAHERAWQQQVLQIQNRLLQLAIARGAADDLPLDIGDMIQRVGELSSTRPALTDDAEAAGALAGPRVDARSDGDVITIEEEPFPATDAQAVRAPAPSPSQEHGDEYGEAGREERRGR